MLERNLIVNGQGAHGPATQRNNYITNSDPGFADFANGDFTLRYDSPAFSKIEGFQPVPFRQMGTTWAVSGQKPEAKFLMVKGSAVANTEIAARFAFYDADGDQQAAPDIQWYIGDSADAVSYTHLDVYKRQKGGVAIHHILPLQLIAEGIILQIRRTLPWLYPAILQQVGNQHLAPILPKKQVNIKPDTAFGVGDV